MKVRNLLLDTNRVYPKNNIGRLAYLSARNCLWIPLLVFSVYPSGGCRGEQRSNDPGIPKGFAMNFYVADFRTTLIPHNMILRHLGSHIVDGDSYVTTYKYLYNSLDSILKASLPIGAYRGADRKQEFPVSTPWRI